MSSNKMRLNLIAAACENMGIGFKNQLPWTLKNEMAFFNRMTETTQDPGKKNAVIMGRNTWESIPEKFRPLHGRINVVLSRNMEFLRGAASNPDTLCYTSFEDALRNLSSPDKQRMIETIWIIGGTSIYKAAIESPFCHRIYLTRIFKTYECDVFFPEFDKWQYNLINDPNVPDDEQEENGVKYRYEIYEKFE